MGGALLIVGLVIGSGVLGRGVAPDPHNGLPAHPEATGAGTARAAAPADASPAGPATAGSLPAGSAAGSPGEPGGALLVTVPESGYQVASLIAEAHPPSILDRGTIAVFGFGPRIGGETFDGTIQVAVGSGGRGAVVAGRAGPAAVSGTTLEELRARYLQVTSGRVVTRSAGELDGQLSVFIRIDDGAAGIRSVALAVHNGRTFVLTATGFGRLFGAVSDVPAETALEAFVAGFSFVPPAQPDARGPVDGSAQLR